MDISSTKSHSSAGVPTSRSVTPSKSSSDRQTYDHQQAEISEAKANERTQEQRVIQEKIQQRNEDNQRRLDGRLISFGQEKDNSSSEQNQASYNRTRVNEAYSPPKNNLTNAHKEQQQTENQREKDAIDIVV